MMLLATGARAVDEKKPVPPSVVTAAAPRDAATATDAEWRSLIGGDAVAVRVWTEHVRDELKDVAKKLRAAARTAMRQSDRIRANCVQDKAVSVQAMVDLSIKALDSVENDLRNRDHVAARHAFDRITHLRTSAATLRKESSQCVGESTVATTEVTPQLTIDDISVPTPVFGSGLNRMVPTHDDSTSPTADANVQDVANVVRPPAASPYF